jgi:hypothetical protein
MKPTKAGSKKLTATAAAEATANAAATAKKTEKPVVLTGGFADLEKSLGALKLNIPTLESLKNIENLQGSVAAKMEAANKIGEGVANAIKYLFEGEKQIALAKNHLERKFIQEEVTEGKEKANAYLDEVFAMKGALKSVAALAYLRTVLTLSYSNSTEVNLMLRNLVERGLLVNSGTGPTVMIGFLHYHLGSWGLDPEDIKEIMAVVEQFSKVVKTMERERRDASVEDMKAKAQISLDEAISGKTGMCLIHVPAEAFKKGTETKWRGGGDILFDFQRNSVSAVQASGSVEKLVTDIAARGVELTRYSLQWDKAPGVWALADSIGRNLNITDRKEAEDYASDFLTLWHMLRRGITHYKALLAQMLAETEMKNKAEITAFQFFGLNGSEGVPTYDKPALLQFNGIIKLPDRNLFNPFVLAKRVNQESFEVVEVPSHLQDILGECIGKQLPLNCRSFPELDDMLHRIYGQQEMAAATATAKPEAEPEAQK